MSAGSRRIVILGLGLITLTAIMALVILAFLRSAPEEAEEEPAAVAILTPTSPPSATSPAAATATATPDTPTPEAADPTPEPAGPDAWGQIRERGTLIVGTAADYPPFAFYTAAFELDGFDVALAEEIGRRLDLDVEIRDMAFDGLAGALEVGQIDLAIAALSVTDEREALIDFSQVYFVSEDAILARSDNPTNPTRINAVEDLADFRVGVQNASVFQNWLQTNLIDPGLMPTDNLLVYSKIDEAVADLDEGLIDFIVGDLLPAQVAAETGDFVIVGQGLNRQHFAAAVRQDSTLLEPINEALAEVEQAGELAQLVETHLGLAAEDILPLPTPAPAPPGRANFGCIDAMTLVSDLSFDDQNMVAPPVFTPGQSFRKGWRIRNLGTCNWNNAYILVYAGGNDPAARMGGQPFVITGEVVPGAEIDLTLNLVAPLVEGEFQGFWSLRANNGLLFGDRLAVGVGVEAAATATPLPTSLPSPTISLTADPTQLTAGECATFTWDVRNAANVYFYAAGEPWQLNQVEAGGTQQECPPVTTTFELRVILADGAADVRRQRIDVQPPSVNAPQITSFTVTPDFQIIVGQCVQIAWQVTGSATQVRLLRNEAPLWDNAPISGGLGDCPLAGNAIYALEVSGPGGTVRAQREVMVIVPAATATAVSSPVPTPTPTGPPPPVINSFSVQPNRIEAGQCVTLNWSAGGGANRVQITRNGRLLLDNGQLTGVATDCLVNSGTYTYRVEARNQADQSAFQQAAVTVDQPTAINPLQGSWTLASLNGQTLSRAVLITAVFGDGGNLSGNAGCNSYSTFYETNGNAVFIGPYSLGQNVCLDPPDIMLLEGRYLSTLQSSNSFVINNNQLTLSGSGELVFIRN